jgi:hypothetical protein
MCAALEPADLVGEILARDAVDATWNIKRWRQTGSEFLSAEIRAEITRQASALVKADPELNSATDEQNQEMEKLLDANSMLTWLDRKARYPRAAAKYDELLEAARLTLDRAEIQAYVLVRHIDTIERLEALIAIEERRFDAIIREFDRRRMMRELRHDLHNAAKAQIKMIAPKLNSGNKKLA